MVEDLLTLARQGQSVGETEQVRLDVVAEEAWAHVDAGAATLSCETTATVAADPDRLREALGNLFRNSVEHGATGSRPEAGDSVEHGSTSNRSAPRSGDIAGRESAGSQDAERSGDSVEYGATGSRPRVDDGASPTGDGGEGREDDRVHVRVGSLPDGFFVEDDGPGIPPSERDRVFEAGYTTAPDGTGFGLNIVRTVVRAHGWDVEATEGRDGGARFEVTGVDVG
jgi:signal transduction histidine kinase